MLSLSEIQTYYPAHLQHRGEFLLREYLQYKILELLFESNYALKFSFLGGTCLRIIHNNNRFSEDLDFDNSGFQPASQIFIFRPYRPVAYVVAGVLQIWRS